MIPPHVEDVAGLGQYPARMLQDLFARFRQPGDALALAHEQVHAKFFLQPADVLRDGRLNHVQPFRGATDVAVGFHQGDQRTELTQFHIKNCNTLS